MTRIERFEADIERLEKKYKVFINTGNFVKAIAIKNDIERIRKMVEDHKEMFRPKDISEVLTKEQIQQSGLIPCLTEIHLVVDYLIACQYTLNDICDKCNIGLVDIQTNLKDIISRSDKMVSDLMARNGWLLDMMTDNETLNEALHKKISSYIKQHTKKPKKKKTTV